MALYKSIVAYDGTDFQGFQRQAAGIRTVQGVLESALAKLGWEQNSLQAAGRTDSGVHAKGQVVSFELSWEHGLETLTRAFNAHLPLDVAVQSSELAPVGFHPRFSASSRRYRYVLFVSQVRNPLLERFALRVWPEPDVESMQELAQAMIGRMEFGAFGSAPIPGGHTIREVMRAAWAQDEGGLTFDIEGDAFLKNMVRRLVAASLAVGRGEIPLEAPLGLLGQSEAHWEGRLAGPQGLCLEAVRYDGKRRSGAIDA